MALFADPIRIAAPTMSMVADLLDALAASGGWLSAPGTWSYSSATVITTSYTATDYHAKGDKIYLVQSSTDKYFYVTSVASNSLTITAGTDYTFTNNVVTGPLYSHAASPRGFPEWFNYTASPSADSPLTLGSVTTYYARFRLDGTTCHIQIAFEGTLGGSAGSQLAFSVPITHKNAGTVQKFMMAEVVNNGAGEVGKIKMELNTTGFKVRRATNGNFSTSGTGGCYSNFFYEIA